MALADFTNAILDGFNSSFISDNEKQLSILKGQLRKVIKRISKSDNDAAKEGLRMELEKLKILMSKRNFMITIGYKVYLLE